MHFMRDMEKLVRHVVFTFKMMDAALIPVPTMGWMLDRLEAKMQQKCIKTMLSHANVGESFQEEDQGDTDETGARAIVRRMHPSCLPGAFAGGKGKSSGKSGGFNRKNPKDKSGQIMKCNKCGSDEHLWRRCPQNQQSGGDGSRPSFVVNPGNTATGTSMALMTSRPNWNTGASSVLPGVHFLTGANSTLGVELENLRSVSQANSVVSEASGVRRGDIRTATESPSGSTRRGSTPEPPNWSPGNHPSGSGINRSSGSVVGEGSDHQSSEVTPSVWCITAYASPTCRITMALSQSQT